jgi:hypothetical protein
MIIKIYSISFVMVALLLPLISIAQANSSERVMVNLSKPGKAFKLNLNLDKGNIKVLAYDGIGIEVEAEPEVNKTDRTEPNKNKNTNTNSNSNINVNETAVGGNRKTEGKHVTVTETNNSVSIKSVSPAKALDIVIRVPRTNGSFNLVILYKGDISMTDVTGEIEANSNNGSIVLSNIAGSAVAASLTGNITVTFKSVKEKSPMAFSSLVGKIDITFPASINANLKLKTDYGKLLTDFKLVADNSKPDEKPEFKPNPQASALKQPGFIINNTGWIYGRINLGGPEIMMKNMQGSIYIRKGN